jgi:hypothetical protein
MNKFKFEVKILEITKNQEYTSADKKSVGFDYQFLYFIYRALELKPGEKIGYEVKDDVHLELNDGKEIFLQLKHSLQTNSDTSIINMTEKDSDLWKSLYNWNLSINEIDETKRLEYINRIEFVLVTNKNNEGNNFFDMTKKLKDGVISIDQYKDYICQLHKSVTGDKSHSEKLRKYMEILTDQKDEILCAFVKRLNFIFKFDDLVKKIKDQIVSNHIDIRKLDEIFERCVGNLSIWKYENIKKGQRVYITFEDIDAKVKHCFMYGRSGKLPRRNSKEIELPNKLEEQEFIKELIEIHDLKINEIKNITKYTTFRLKIENLFDTWVQENYVTETDRDEFISMCISLWTNHHRQAHMVSNKEIRKGKMTTDELNECLCDCAVNCLCEVRNNILEFCEEKLSIDESNGAFYSLSEQRKIGWKLDWERAYRQ